MLIVTGKRELTNIKNMECAAVGKNFVFNRADLSGWTPWIEGVAEGYMFQAKVMDSPSPCGVDGSRVIKLAAYKQSGSLGKQFILNYDRGWDIRPEGAEHEKVYQAIMDLLEHRK